MKPHYFEQQAADTNDIHLLMAKGQGYVPQGCLLGGPVVMLEVMAGTNPCWGCEGPREKCGGKPKRAAGVSMLDRTPTIQPASTAEK